MTDIGIVSVAGRLLPGVEVLVWLWFLGLGCCFGCVPRRRRLAVPVVPVRRCFRGRKSSGGSDGCALVLFSPAGGDDVGFFFGVGYGEGAYGGAVPEGLGFVFGVVDGMRGGADVDTCEVVAVGFVDDPGD